MDINNLKKIRQFQSLEKNNDLTLQIFEFGLSALSAILAEAWINYNPSPDKYPNKIWAILCILVTLILLIQRLRKNHYFPQTLFEHLTAESKLKDSEKQLYRKTTIDTYIDQAIQTLNLKTCGLNTDEQNHLCDTSLEEGLKNVLKHIISHTHYFLDCNLSKFTIAVHFRAYPNIVNSFDITYNSKTILLRDDYSISAHFTDNILANPNVIEFNFEIYQSALVAYNHYGGHLTEFANFKGQSMLTSPVPAVCENSCNGLIFIVYDSSVKLPDDIWNILLIFGRVASNYISKYEDCVNSRKTAAEIKELKSVASVCTPMRDNPNKMTDQ
jgi:hypothetical protein